MLIRVIVLAVLLASTLVAQEPGIEYEKVLIPVLLSNPVRGAFGSVWSTSFWITNNADRPVSILPYFWGCRTMGCGFPPPTPPGVSFMPAVAATDEISGMFMFVERAKAEDVAFALRVRDESRQHETWGTEVPVAREREFRPDRITLTDIPISAGFRPTLRVYSINPREGSRVRINAFAINPSRQFIFEPKDTFLGEAIFHLKTTLDPFDPGYAQISDFGFLGNPPEGTRIRLELLPLPPTERIWAFVTITHNETQHVTTITPE